MNISIITFTENGTKLAEKIRQAFVGTKMEEAKKLGLSLSDWTRQQFAEKNAIVVIGACGIAVRMIAPFVSDKLSDSPVVVADGFILWGQDLERQILSRYVECVC